MDKKAPERSGASDRLKGYIRTFIDLSSRWGIRTNKR
jgi:hypothetical protein